MDRHTDRETYIYIHSGRTTAGQTNRQDIHIHTFRQNYRWTDRHTYTYIQADLQMNKQTDRETYAYIQEDLQMGRQRDIHVHTFRQTYRWTDRHTDGHRYKLLDLKSFKEYGHM
jgi:hypothetical protein